MNHYHHHNQPQQSIRFSIPTNHYKYPISGQQRNVALAHTNNNNHNHNSTSSTNSHNSNSVINQHNKNNDCNNNNNNSSSNNNNNNSNNSNNVNNNNNNNLNPLHQQQQYYYRPQTRLNHQQQQQQQNSSSSIVTKSRSTTAPNKYIQSNNNNNNNSISNNSNNNNNNNRKLMHQLNHNQVPLYEGVDNVPGSLLNSNSYSINYNGPGAYSNAVDIDPGFFVPNEYDNATAAVMRMPNAYNRTPLTARNQGPLSPGVSNGGRMIGVGGGSSSGGSISSMSAIPIGAQFDRNMTMKLNNNNSAATLAEPASASIKFETIRKNCISNRALFVDPEFPPRDTSLHRQLGQKLAGTIGLAGRPTVSSLLDSVATESLVNNSGVKWMRPAEIVEQHNRKFSTNLRPEFQLRPLSGHQSSIGGSEKCNISQGRLGDCWIVTSLATVISHDYERTNVLNRLVPSGQNFRSGWYSGVFLFRFWRDGEWRDIVVDDLLPTVDGQLIYIRSDQPNEFWSALLEKAYAKLNGGYESLDCSQLSDVLDDFTGGMTESYSREPIGADSNENMIRKSAPLPIPADIDDQLIRAFECHSLMTVSILNKQSSGISFLNNQSTSDRGVVLANGLMSEQSYTISDIRKIKLTEANGNSYNQHQQQLQQQQHQHSIITLLRIRNPWGERIDWRGAWSERSQEWLSISDEDKRAVGLVIKSDGEFWMSMADFLVNFDTLDICHLPADVTVLPVSRHNSSTVTKRYRWQVQEFRGEWKVNISAGGRPKLVNTHFMNPQFRFEVPLSSSTTSVKSMNCNSTSLLIGLLQQDPRGGPFPQAVRGNLSIGFVIYELKQRDLHPPLNQSFFKSTQYIASVDSFINSREVVKRFNMVPGSTYLIVPCTYDAGQPGRFLLRIFMPFSSGVPTGTTDLTDYTTPSVMTNTLQQLSKLDPSRENVVRQMFYRESGSDMALTPIQLRKLLNNLLRERSIDHELSLDCCRALSVLFGTETSSVAGSGSTLVIGRVVRDEKFAALWSWLMRALKYIQAGDSLGPLALRSAVDSLAITITDRSLAQLTQRLSNNSGFVSVSAYLQILAILTKHSEVFEAMQTNGSVTLGKDEYLNLMTLI